MQNTIIHYTLCSIDSNFFFFLWSSSPLVGWGHFFNDPFIAKMMGVVLNKYKNVYKTNNYVQYNFTIQLWLTINNWMVVIIYYILFGSRWFGMIWFIYFILIGLKVEVGLSLQESILILFQLLGTMHSDTNTMRGSSSEVA